MDDSTFSEQSRYFLAKYATIDRAEAALWREWERMLLAVRADLGGRGYLTEIHVDPRYRNSHLQAALPHWPVPFSESVHFEFGLGAQGLRTNDLHVGLHVEGDDPRNQAVLESLVRLLTPYERAGVLLKATGMAIHPRRPFWATKRSVPVLDASAEQLIDVTASFDCLASFVDEALFVAAGQPIWRTDLFSSQPLPEVSYCNRGVGGLALHPNGGQMDSPSLIVNGRIPGNHDPVDGRPTNIMYLPGTRKDKRHTGINEDLYLSCIVKSPSGGRLWFIGEGHYRDAENQQVFPQLFDYEEWPSVPIEGKDAWQHVGMRVRARKAKEYDFSKGHVWIYVRVQTQDPQFLINSIEFGRTSTQ